MCSSGFLLGCHVLRSERASLALRFVLPGHDCVRVQHLFHQMVESLQAQQDPLPSSVTLPPALSDPLFAMLKIGEKRDAVIRHVRSLKKQVESTMAETTALLHTIGVVEARDLNRTMRGVQDNTSVLEASMHAEHSTSVAVELIQVGVFQGSGLQVRLVLVSILVFDTRVQQESALTTPSRC